MTSFEAGFVKYAKECGLADQSVTQLFKRAMDHPGMQHMFKELPEETQPQSPDNLAALSEMLQQHLVHSDMETAAKRIQL